MVILALITSVTGCGGWLGALKSPVPGPGVTSSTFFKGMTQAAYQATVFDSPAVRSSLPILKRAHVNTLAIQVMWYQATPTSTTIAPSPTDTPTDDSVAALIRRAHRSGMYVFLNPFVNAVQGNPWQADFHPTSWHTWFLNYDRFLAHYATIAQREHVEVFAIGDEQDSADGVPGLYPEWKKAIQTVRRIYDGPVTYGADTANYKKVTFYKDLDYVGLDAYFPLAPAGVNHPTEKSLERTWNTLADEIEAWRKSAGLASKPVFINELGYYSGVGVAAEPGFWNPQAAVDLRAQSDCYRATLNTIYKRPWLKGLTWFWWANPSNPHWQGGPTDNGYTLRGKPALGVLTEGFKAPRPFTRAA